MRRPSTSWRTGPRRTPRKRAPRTTEPSRRARFPQLYQWDERWGYTTYSSTSFALTGCCPTSLSMVYMELTGKTDKDALRHGACWPEKTATRARTRAPSATSLRTTRRSWAWVCEKIDIDSGTLKYYLKQGYVVICNVGAGDFTDGGHYFVITGLDGQGEADHPRPLLVRALREALGHRARPEPDHRALCVHDG
ncbi:MAG: C39 family peptidase [Eggerthellaceae bacterium]